MTSTGRKVSVSPGESSSVGRRRRGGRRLGPTSGDQDEQDRDQHRSRSHRRTLPNPEIGGAGGNRTPVRHAVTVRATTIPELPACGSRPAGSGGPRGPTAGSFPGASGLSRRQRSVPAVTNTSVAGLCWSGPACHCWSRCLSTACYQAARANSPSAVLLLPPFKESEATPVARGGFRVTTSKPISPVFSCSPHVTAGRTTVSARARGTSTRPDSSMAQPWCSPCLSDGPVTHRVRSAPRRRSRHTPQPVRQ